MSRATLAVALVGAVAVGCTDTPAPVETEGPSAHITGAMAAPCDPALAAHIRAQIVVLFPGGRKLRQAAQTQFDAIERKCRTNRSDAQAKAMDLVDFTMQKFNKRQLLTSDTDLVTAFVTDVLAYVGAGAIGPEGTIAVVGPSEEEQIVTTADGQAGVSFPAGAWDQTVVVTIAPSADQTDPLPTTLPQFGPFYDFAAFPSTAQFQESPTLSICVDVSGLPPEVVARLQLAHPAPGGSGIELLPGAFGGVLGCAAAASLGPAAQSLARAAPPSLGRRLRAWAAAFLWAAPLHAAEDVEVIGAAKTPGNFTGNPYGTVDGSAPDLIVATLTLTPTTPTAGGLATLTAKVSNVGRATAPSSVLGIRSHGVFVDDVPVPALAPGESFDVITHRVVINTGLPPDTAIADVDGQVTELVETNNQTTLEYVVNPGDPVPPLNGSPGTVGPVVDGVLSPGEWANADCLPFVANTGIGTNTTPAFLCLMNDATTLYLTVAYRRATGGAPTDPPTDLDAQVVFEFDNDGDGQWENGDDELVYGTDGNFFDNFRTNDPPCQSGVAEASCGFNDPGVPDGVAAFERDQLYTVFEVAHPLNSADDAHDFSLVPLAQAGMFFSLSIFVSDGAGGFTGSTTLVPGPAFGIFVPVIVDP